MAKKIGKIAFVGGGKMAEALIGGILSSGIASPASVCSSDPSPKRRGLLRSRYKVRSLSDNVEAIKGADTIVLAVKPQMLAHVVSGISGSISKDQLVISIAAGVTAKAIKKMLPSNPVIRVMPNNPAMVRKGVTAIAKASITASRHYLTAEKIFSSVGDVVRVNENLMDAVTAVSGSGPAFVYLFAEAMEDAAASLGLGEAEASVLVSNTLLGAASTLIGSKLKPGRLREMVASPGGTTLAGLKVLSSKGFKKAIVSAIIASARRSGELGRAFGAK